MHYNTLKLLHHILCDVTCQSSVSVKAVESYPMNGAEHVLATDFKMGMA